MPTDLFPCVIKYKDIERNNNGNRGFKKTHKYFGQSSLNFVHGLFACSYICAWIHAWTGWGCSAASGTASSHFLCLTELSECIGSPPVFQERRACIPPSENGWKRPGRCLHPQGRTGPHKERYGRRVNIQNLTVRVRQVLNPLTIPSANAPQWGTSEPGVHMAFYFTKQRLKVQTKLLWTITVKCIVYAVYILLWTLCWCW